MEMTLAISAVLILVAANAFATRRVVRDEFAERSHRVAQVLAIWLLPVLGAILVFAIHRRPEEASRQYRAIPDAGDDFGASGRSVRSTQSHPDD